MQRNPYYGECPLDKPQLGKSSWEFLHTMAAYYSPEPSYQEQRDMYLFINLFAQFYPCKECGHHFQQYIRHNAPDVRSNFHLATWLCTAHNVVNRRLHKPIFDCYLHEQRWRTGWTDGSCNF